MQIVVIFNKNERKFEGKKPKGEVSSLLRKEK